MAAAWMAAAMTAILQGTSWAGTEAAPITITFEQDRVHGALSCNRFNAGYTEEEATLDIGAVALTRMACPPGAMQKERLVVKILENTASFSMEGDELVLKDAAGQEILRLTRKS